MGVVDEIRELFQQRGDSLYGGEAVTQLQHALQAAWAAEMAEAGAALITAALLHDVGHLLHDLRDDAPDEGIDDRHEELGEKWLARHFGSEVTEPVRLHVAAKRYLCAVEPDYFLGLSPTSLQSLKLQGGPYSGEEVQRFESLPSFHQAVDLRRWDDEAKVVGLVTPDLQHFLPYAKTAASEP